MFKLVLAGLLPTSVRYQKLAEFLGFFKQSKLMPKLSPDTGDKVLGCCIAYNEHGAYCVPISSSHRPAAQMILAGKVWEPETLAFMVANISGGDVVHAGTYFGDFLPVLSRAANSSNHVWAFEPNFENYRCASITVALNDLQNVTLIGAALGAEPGHLNMEIFDSSGRALGGASRVVSSDAAKHVTSVRVETVDRIVPADRHVVLLQLDVEGFEQQALAGAIKTIRRCRPILILENLPPRNWLNANIFNLGYRESGKLHDNFVLICDVSFEKE